MTAQKIPAELATAFEYCYLHEEWVTPLAEALEGVDAQSAYLRPAGSEKGIWDIVLHMAVWNENIIERTRTGEKVRPSEGAWPERPAEPSEAARQEAKDRLEQSFRAMQDMLRTSTLDELAHGPYGVSDIVCRFIHNAYHIGQLTKMRPPRP